MIIKQAVWKDDVVTLLRNSVSSLQPSPPNISPVICEKWQRFFWAKCLGERELKRFALKLILILRTNHSPSQFEAPAESDQLCIRGSASPTSILDLA